MDFDSNKLLLALIALLVLIAILQFLFLYRLSLLLKEIIHQLQESRAESRTLLRNVMSSIQDVSRTLAIELRDEFDKSKR